LTITAFTSYSSVMTTRDAYDIEEARRMDLEEAKAQIRAAAEKHHEYSENERQPKRTRSINVQPALLVQYMKDSEPCLFGNQSELAVEPVENLVDTEVLVSSPYAHPYVPLYSSFPEMIKTTRWHAGLQKTFDREFKDELRVEERKS